jgi:predicted GIY-YIG superfamily endonuclease
VKRYASKGLALSAELKIKALSRGQKIEMVKGIDYFE